MKLRHLAPLTAVFALALVPAAPAADTTADTGKPVEFVKCVVRDALTPPPQEPHTPVFCQL